MTSTNRLRMLLDTNIFFTPVNHLYIYKFVFYLRYKPKTVNNESQALTPGEDLTSDYMNILGMILSMCGLLMKVK